MMSSASSVTWCKFAAGCPAERWFGAEAAAIYSITLGACRAIPDPPPQVPRIVTATLILCPRIATPDRQIDCRVSVMDHTRNRDEQFANGRHRVVPGSNLWGHPDLFRHSLETVTAGHGSPPLPDQWRFAYWRDRAAPVVFTVTYCGRLLWCFADRLAFRTNPVLGRRGSQVSAVSSL